MTNTKARIADLESQAQHFAKLAQFEFSPVAARHFRGTAARLMAEAQNLRTADLEEAAERWTVRTGRDADRWYNDRAAARMGGEFL